MQYFWRRRPNFDLHRRGQKPRRTNLPATYAIRSNSLCSANLGASPHAFQPSLWCPDTLCTSGSYRIRHHSVSSTCPGTDLGTERNSICRNHHTRFQRGLRPGDDGQSQHSVLYRFRFKWQSIRLGYHEQLRPQDRHFGFDEHPGGARRLR